MNASLNKNKTVLKIITIFGGCTIHAPRNMDIDTQVLSIFGGFSDDREVIVSDEMKSDRELIIRGITLFGGGSIE